MCWFLFGTSVFFGHRYIVYSERQRMPILLKHK